MKGLLNRSILARYAGAIFLSLLAFTCSKDELDIDYSTIYVLQQTLNGKKVASGATGIDTKVSIEIVFSHTLNTAKFQEALSFTGPSGAVAFDIAYSNTNSTITLTNKTRLGYETAYTISVNPGKFGNGEEELKTPFVYKFTTKAFVPANVALSADVLKLAEAAGISTVTATLSEDATEPVTVNLAFEGTATGSDFTASATSITIPVGSKTGTITITAVQDNTTEGEETVIVRISSIVNAIELTPQVVTLGILDDDIDSNGDGIADQGFIINEILFDPPDGLAGDANRDGTRSPSEDEFIEFINDSNKEVDLSGFTVFDETNLATNTPRHVFPANTKVPPGGVYVLFGGGRPTGDFGTAQTGVATTSNLNLNNAGDMAIIKDRDGKVFLTFSTATDGAGLDFNANKSITRSPDINGPYAAHTDANPALAYSPGAKTSGQPFAAAEPPGKGFIINEVLFDPPNDLAGDANGDGTRSPSADEFIEFYNDQKIAVDLSGFTLFDETGLAANTPRHVFPANTVVPPKGVYVLFGGGTPTGSFGGAQTGVTTTGDMNLSNASDVLTIKDKNGNVFLTFNSATDAAGINFGIDQSVTRSPDITGGFVLHKTANGALAYSPGTRVDGSKL